MNMALPWIDLSLVRHAEIERTTPTYEEHLHDAVHAGRQVEVDSFHPDLAEDADQGGRRRG